MFISDGCGISPSCGGLPDILGNDMLEVEFRTMMVLDRLTDVDNWGVRWRNDEEMFDVSKENLILVFRLRLGARGTMTETANSTQFTQPAKSWFHRMEGIDACN